MDSTYRTNELAKAEAEVTALRAQIVMLQVATRPNRTALSVAFEELEFWTNRTANLHRG